MINPSSNPRLAFLFPHFPAPADIWIQREMDMLMRLGWEIYVFALAYDSQQIAAMPSEIRALTAGMGERTRPSPRLAGVEVPTDPEDRLPADTGQVRKTVMNLYRGQPLKMLEMRAFNEKMLVLAREMRVKRIGHVIAQYATRPALGAWIIQQLTGTPYSIRVHGPELAGISPETGAAVKSAAFLAAATQSAQEMLRKDYGESVAGRTRVIHYGLDVNAYPQRVGILRAEPPFEVICERPLEPKQGLESLVDACAELLSEGLPLHLQIMGEGTLRKPLQKKIDQLQQKNAIELTGELSLDERTRRMAAADCYIDPLPELRGEREALPLALFEALACSLPVVATNIAGRDELVRHYETGVLIPPGDSSTLASGIRDIYNGPAKAARMARAGRALILNEFDAVANARALGDLILQKS